jgi:hypothetical protein
MSNKNYVYIIYYGAQVRWTLTHALRTTITTHFLESIGIIKKEDVTQDLSKTSIQNYHKNFEKIISIINKC